MSRKRDLILNELPSDVRRSVILYSRHVLKWAQEKNESNRKPEAGSRKPDTLYEDFFFNTDRCARYTEPVKKKLTKVLLYELALYFELIKHEGKEPEEIDGVHIIPVGQQFSCEGYLSGNGMPATDDSLN